MKQIREVVPSNQVHDTIPRHSVDSTTLASVGYDPSVATLEIEFLSEAVYRYENVPLKAYFGLMSADSKSRYFGEEIRDLYSAFRVL